MFTLLLACLFWFFLLSFDSLLNFICRTRPACEKLACGSHKFGKFVIGGGFATGTCSGCGQSMLVCVCAKGFFGCIDAVEFEAVLSKLEGEAEGTKELHSEVMVEEEKEKEKEEVPTRPEKMEEQGMSIVDV